MDLAYLKALLAEHGITQTDLANILGRDKSVITNLFQGKRQLKASEVTVIARHIGVPVAQVMGVAQEAGGQLREPPGLIPFQHEPSQKKAAHIVRQAGKSFLKLADSEHPSSKAYALEMHDDSMNMLGILPGDILISELDRPCKPGQVVIAQHYQARGATTLVRKYEPPFLLAGSMSLAFPPLPCDSEETRIVSPVLRVLRIY